ncbi:MAG TPA: ABC transporter ATP-binding protein [Hypericibacter adhaerens]|jgi:spermidine/putrescine transport system ATP-binding protein|uniref:Spermidine/putrescine ABC transporter ATP-binding protein n=1 Tax=Hypericibacter adhaerens TaxID=2602016 RepID=A0A5J6MYU0_9PROT|nr:ABC transporter ATP-binding protein [Hypericibacter adhaerens]QEX21755.1 spermidine/putrescine ABC transporter ATP-binding protein [Hypericibacter adhaerens]HWA42442.1 ABC transporter ATP-binding protein [Hypericibacter adhaerens]
MAETAREPLVRLEGLCKSYEGQVAVERFNLTIAKGEFVVLLGPSGSGKTTVLSMLGGFTEPSEGRVLIEGADVTALPPAKRPTATVFQDYALFPHMSVRANVGFGLAMRKVAKAERDARAEEVLKLVGLEGFGARRVHQLSGGQRQRVALARAIAVKPAVLLLDEPLGALDLALRRQMQEELVHIQKRLGTSFVHVTHDQEEAMSVADTIVVMNKGRVEDRGAPARIYRRPASLFTATFMGENNILPAKLAGRNGEELTVDTALGRFLLTSGEGLAGLGPGASLHVAVRPEQIFPAATAPEDAAPLGAAVLTELVFQGTHWRAHAKAGANGALPLLLRLPPELTPAVGQILDLYARPPDMTALVR